MPPHAKLTSIAAGRQATAHQEDTSPSAAITIKKAIDYTVPRMSDQASSPIATSRTPSGVASTAS